jgi:hypothetical protein
MVHNWFVAFDALTRALPANDAGVKDTRTIALDQCKAARDEFATLWATRFPKESDREAYMHPAPVKKTLEQQVYDLTTAVVSIQDTISKTFAMVETLKALLDDQQNTLDYIRGMLPGSSSVRPPRA